jgi:catechol 2,3-dioxygenase-like lactoylglutathione lyase family enzyme
MELEALDHVALIVSDIGRSIRWYQDVLGLRRVHEEAWGDDPAVLHAGGSGVALFAAGASDPAPAPGGGDVAMQHLAFRTTRQRFESAQDELRAMAIDFLAQDHGVSWSIYLRDPDGYEVEITTYESAG